jgi:hypothetical protein
MLEIDLKVLSGDYTYFVLFLLLADVVEKLVDLLRGAKTMGFPFSV